MNRPAETTLACIEYLSPVWVVPHTTGNQSHLSETLGKKPFSLIRKHSMHRVKELQEYAALAPRCTAAQRPAATSFPSPRPQFTARWRSVLFVLHY